MLAKFMLCLVAFAFIALSAAIVPTTKFSGTNNANVLPAQLGGNVTVDVDHPPARLDVHVGTTITFVRYGGSPGGNVTINAYNSDGQVGQLFSDFPGGPIGTVHTLRVNRKGFGQIIVQYPAKGGFAQSMQISVTVR